MPRKPTHPSPLREIREAIGFTQEEMGDLIGVFRGIIQKLENGQMKLPLELALKYRVATGCDLEETSEELQVLATVQGKPFTKEAFDLHQEANRVTNSEEAEKAIAGAVESLKMVLESAGIEELSGILRSFEVWRMKLVHASDIQT